MAKRAAVSKRDEKAPSVLAGFFSDEIPKVLAAVAALESGSEEGRTFGAVTSTDTFTRERGSDRLLFASKGLFSEETFGPAGSDEDRYGVIEVRQVVHPAVYGRELLGALGWFGIDLRGIARGERCLRGGNEVECGLPEEGDVVGAQGLADALRAIDPQHPLLPLLTIRKIPVPPPHARPFIRDLAPTMIDPWIGPINHAWLELIHRAPRVSRLLEVNAPQEIVFDESRIVQEAFERVCEAQKPRRPLVPPLLAPLPEVEEKDALGLAFVDGRSLVVQRASAIHIVSDSGRRLRKAQPAASKLIGVVRDRIAVFQEFLDIPCTAHKEAWGEFVSESADGAQQIAPHFGSISALDCKTGAFLRDAPGELPSGLVENDQPEDLYFVDPSTGRSFQLHIGGDRPGVLGHTRDLALAWVGEDPDTQVIELARGITHVVPAHPGDKIPTIQLAEKHGEDDEDFDDDSGYGSAVTFRGGRFYFLWPHGYVADHRGKRAFRIHPEPRAGAFDSSGERLAVIVRSEVVIIDVDRRKVLRRFPLPGGELTE